MILTHNQLALENSLRRILPAGVVSCWIPDGYGKAKDVIGGNHGRVVGAHPNVPTIASPIAQQISACDALTGWSALGASASLSIDEADFKEGTGSLKNTVSAPTFPLSYYTIYETPSTQDWSDKKYILFWFYCDRPSTAFATSTFYIEGPTALYNLWNLTFSASTWTAFEFLLSAPDSQSVTLPDLASTIAVYPRFTTKDTTPFYLKIDDIRVTAKPFLINPSVGHVFGGDDYVDVPHDSSITFTSEDFSVGGWLYVKDLTSAHIGIINKGDSVVDGWYLLFNRTNQTLFLRSNQLGTQQTQASTADILAVHKWYFITFTRSGNTVKIFVNNVDRTGAHINITDPAISTRALKIGCYNELTLGLNGHMVLPFLAKGAWSLQQHNNIYLATKGMFAPIG